MIVFFHSDKPREIMLANAFTQGAITHGLNAVTSLRGTPIPADVTLACMVGVKSLKLWRYFQKRGIPTMMFDKGYSRHTKGGCWEYWRVSYNAHNPTRTTLMSVNHPSDRFDRLGFDVKPWRTGGDHILFAGSSAKYQNFQRMRDPTSYAVRVIQALRKHTDRPIIYRPKPSWRDAVEIPGTIYSGPKQPLQSVFDNCHAVVTHGSNTSFEAALNGIPSVVLGDAVMRSISITDLCDVESPLIRDRSQVFYNLAYHQWTLSEFESGEAFETIGEWLCG